MYGIVGGAKTLANRAHNFIGRKPPSAGALYYRVYTLHYMVIIENQTVY